MKKNLLTFVMALSAMFTNAQTVLFQDGFESGPPFDTTAYPCWRLHPNLTGSNGLIDIANIISCGNGQFLARIGKSSDGGFTKNGLDLNINLSGQTHVDLTFSIFSHDEETNPLDGICLSNDGGATFSSVVFTFNTESWCQENCGQYPPIHLEQLAAKAGKPFTNQYVIRFQQFDDADFTGWNGSSNTLYDGIYIDNVKVEVPNLTYTTIPFTESFDAGLFGNFWTWEFADSTTSSNIAIPTLIDNFASLTAGGSNGTPWKLQLGKTCGDGTYTSSARDLHLDLSNQSGGIDLTFDIASNDEEYNVNDGLWFSADGGVHFEKVFDFVAQSPGNWCQNSWGHFPPIHLDKLAISHGLNPYSSNFVIRFEQAGDADFTGWNGSSNTDADGIFIDNINVYPVSVNYHALPFQETFESGTFNNSWTIEFGDSTAFAANVCNKIDGVLDIVNGLGSNSAHSARFGKSCEGNGFIDNVLDLHVDLTNVVMANLTFDIRNQGQENDSIQDYIFFSNDGGLHFVPAYYFVWSNLPVGQFVTESFDIDSFASQNGLGLTNNCIIRFQQYGNADFTVWNGSSNTDADGYYLDNINITGTVGIDENNPFSSFSIYPNPAKNNITVLLPEVNNYPTTLSIINLLGEELHSEKFSNQNNLNVDVSNLTSGIYFISIENEKGKTTRKLVKQ